MTFLLLVIHDVVVVVVRCSRHDVVVVVVVVVVVFDVFDVVHVRTERFNLTKHGRKKNHTTRGVPGWFPS